MHRSHPTVKNRPCYLKFRQEPRISAWAPGAAGAAGQLDVSMGDFQEMYGGGRYQSESPEPGDDLRDPPSDFDEDLLGGGQPPGGGAAASAPRPPDQVYQTYMYIYGTIRTYTYQYVPLSAPSALCCLLATSTAAVPSDVKHALCGFLSKGGAMDTAECANYT